MSTRKVIGIVGGVGPYAGLDLNRKIFDQTIATSDQEHLKTILISSSVEIPDRTEYLLGKTKSNPANAILKVLHELELAGAGVAGIPCNTAHATEIFDILIERLRENGSQIEVVHMIKAVSAFIKKYFPGIDKVGILGTSGTFYSGVYTKIFEPEGFQVIYPDNEIQDSKVHLAIYHRDFGLKAKSSPVTKTAQELLMEAVENLIEKGAECLILGCTELPLAIRADRIQGRMIVDPTLILARALIGKVAPEKLRRFSTPRKPEIISKFQWRLASGNR
jgi:aspartate racemase